MYAHSFYCIGIFTLQVTTHAKLLSNADIERLCEVLKMRRKAVTHVRLQAFATEQQFSRCIRCEIINKLLEHKY